MSARVRRSTPQGLVIGTACPPCSRGQQCHVSAGLGAVMLHLLLSRNRRCCSSGLFVKDLRFVFWVLVLPRAMALQFPEPG